MAVQMTPSATLPWLMEPESPPDDASGSASGFRRSKNRPGWHLTTQGAATAGVAQRIVLSYALGYETREELARRYGYALYHVQHMVVGETWRWLTLPIRRRLLANGIGNLRMNRSHRRDAEIKRALERLSAGAVEMIRRPERYSAEQREAVALDLWLISGAWRDEDRP